MANIWRASLTSTFEIFSFFRSKPIFSPGPIIFYFALAQLKAENRIWHIQKPSHNGWYPHTVDSYRKKVGKELYWRELDEVPSGSTLIHANY